MDEQALQGRLAFLKAAEALKDTLRSGHTSHGRPESTAEHSWRLCVLALAFEDAFNLDYGQRYTAAHPLTAAIMPARPRYLRQDAGQGMIPAPFPSSLELGNICIFL